jgi:hypothetical protein
MAKKVVKVRIVAVHQNQITNTIPIRGWLKATGLYLVRHHDPVLIKLLALTCTALFGADVTAMVIELLGNLVGFIPGDILVVPETPIAVALGLLAFWLFKIRKKIRSYRY